MTHAEITAFNTGVATAAGLARRIAETIEAGSKRPIAEGFAVEALQAFADEAWHADVTTVTGSDTFVVTSSDGDFCDIKQCLEEHVTTVTSVTTENSDVEEKEPPAQIEPFRCWICLGIEAPERPLLPIMTSQPGLHRWMHGDECWNEHVRRCAIARGENPCTIDDVKHTRGGDHAP